MEQKGTGPLLQQVNGNKPPPGLDLRPWLGQWEDLLGLPDLVVAGFQEIVGEPHSLIPIHDLVILNFNWPTKSYNPCMLIQPF